MLREEQRAGNTLQGLSEKEGVAQRWEERAGGEESGSWDPSYQLVLSSEMI